VLNPSISAGLEEVRDTSLTVTIPIHVFYGSQCSVDTGVVCQGVRDLVDN
jgi:hypothetical protein